MLKQSDRSDFSERLQNRTRESGVTVMNGSADVIITVYKPDGKFEALLLMLLRQTVKPGKIIIMNTEKAPEFTTEAVRRRVERLLEQKPVRGSGSVEIQFESVGETEFDHGGTRHRGALNSQAEFLIYVTQDAVPADVHMTEALLRPFDDAGVAAAYGRQLCCPSDSGVERFTHEFNYPETSQIKSAADLKTLGIKAYFCSDVCAAYRRSIYDELGGFVRHTIFNEDMLMSAAMIDAGYRTAYAADAKVYHSHHYTPVQQFRRNFDLGVSHRQYAEVFDRVKSESEGIRLVKATASYLIQHGRYAELPGLLLNSACKYAGYLLGKHYESLPDGLTEKVSMNRNYWKK